MNIPEHPDVAAIQRTGYPSWIECENRDTMAELKEYATEYALEIIEWLLNDYPGIIQGVFKICHGLRGHDLSRLAELRNMELVIWKLQQNYLHGQLKT